MAKSIDSFGLLAEARKYINPSVQRALIEIADRLEGFGKIGTEPSPGYCDLRFFVDEESHGLLNIENRSLDTEFMTLKEYAEGLSMSGEPISENELMQELACAGLIAVEDECEDFKPNGLYLEHIDKGMMKQEGDTYYISSRGCCVYQDWLHRGGYNYYKK